MSSLTETAKAILMKESNDSTPDRDAKSTTENKSTLKPKAKYADGPKKLDGEVEDLGTAVTSPTDERKGPATANKGNSKDTSKVHRGETPPEPTKSLKEDEDTLDEEIEMTEELESFIAEKVSEGLDEDEILQAIEENFEVAEQEIVSEDTEEDGATVAEADILETPVVDMAEHVEALFAGEELSEEFQEKAKTIFEAAVNERLVAEKVKMEAAYKAALAEQVEVIHNELSESVENHLNYAVDQWVSDNEVAIESGLRSELTEEFISGLRQLFIENYIDIPEEKISVVEELGSKVQELTDKLNEQIEINVAQNAMINEAKAYEVFDDLVDGLTDTQVEKLKSLAEGIEFSTVDEYRTKIQTLRESYFPAKVIKENTIEKLEDDGRTLIAEDSTGPMADYEKAIGRFQKR